MSTLQINEINKNNVVTIDFETYYGDKYSLTDKAMNTSEYVRDERFKVHLVGIKIGQQPTKVYSGDEAKAALQAIDWTQHALLCQNTAFDGFILAEHYGIIPAVYLDTLSMSRAVNGPAQRHGLAYIAPLFGFAGKVRAKALSDTKNIRDLDPSSELYKSLGEYCVDDVEDTCGVFWKMYDSLTDNELQLIDITIRGFCDPVLLVDTDRVQAELDREVAEKIAALLVSGVKADTLSSANKFAEELRALGVEPPTKISKTTGKEAYAFASTDRGLMALQNHEDIRVRNLVEARLKVKSTIGETRAQRFLKAGENGNKLPILLNYCGAHTFRWCMPGDSEVLTRSGWTRMDAFVQGDIVQWEESGEMRWAFANMNKFPFSGELITCSNDHIYGSFTPEHSFATITTQKRIKHHTAKTAYGKNIRVPISGKLNTNGISLTPAEIKLLVATQADGTVENQTSRPLRFKFRKERKIDRLREICKEANIPLQEFVSGKELVMSIPRTSVPKFLWGAKQFTYDLLQLPMDQRLLFLDELKYWDGTINSKYTHYTTTNKVNAEVVATMAHVSGLAANVCRSPRELPENDKYTVTIRNRENAIIQSHQWQKTMSNDNVFCPTTETGFFLVRSKGKIFVTGNSGGNKMNLQNLPRGGELRRSLLAPPGHVVVVSDSAQIEARLNAWLSDELGLLDVFRAYDAGEGPDAYRIMASALYNIPVNQVTDEQRFVGKVCVLALGYGMGEQRLKDTLETGAMGPAITLPDIEYLRAKNTYRFEYRHIAAMWKKAQGFLHRMVLTPDNTVGFEYKCLQFGKDWVRLPNGMFLRYPELSSGEDGMSYRTLDGHARIYGGLFVENLVQALARVIIADQMLAIHRAGYRIVTMTHDEIVVVCSAEQAEQCKADMTRIMSTPPEWAPTLPLSVKCEYDTCYSK